MCSSRSFLAISIVFYSVVSGSDVIVDTTLGAILGRVAVADIGYETIPVQEFLGVPFAAAPVGDLRFRHPRPVAPWSGSGAYNATGLAHICYQRQYPPLSRITSNTRPESEDCLYLNIWSRYPPPAPSSPTPVMVWIHGGSMETGSSSSDLLDGKVLAGFGNVVVVTTQYRLGPLGFLALGHSQAAAPGNAALMDQRMAISWVHEHISAFGGDPERVTLFGESAGAVSVSLHLLSPGSWQYFTRGILESGTVNSDYPTRFSSMEFATQQGLELAKSLSCPHDPDDIDSVTECLKQLDPATLSAFDRDLVFPPVIDGNFLPKSPFEILASGEFYKTEILTGINRNEGTLFLLSPLPHIFNIHSDEAHMNRTEFERSMIRLTPGLNQFQQQAVIFRYTDWSDTESSERLVRGLESMLGDRRYACPMSDFVSSYVNQVPEAGGGGGAVYVYEFTHRSSGSIFPAWCGVAHMDEIWYVFGVPLRGSTNHNYTSDERDLARRIITYWTNFAGTGNPNFGGDSVGESRWTGVSWEPLVSPSVGPGMNYMILDAGNGTRMVTGGSLPRTDHCALWSHYIPTLDNLTSDGNHEECDHIENFSRSLLVYDPVMLSSSIILAIFASFHLHHHYQYFYSFLASL